MRITESKLRRLIRNELLRENPFIGLMLADEALPDEYEGLLDVSQPETFLLNPVTAYNRMQDPRISEEAKELTRELSLIPLLGVPFSVTEAIYEAMDGNFRQAGISLTIAIIDVIIAKGLSKWIKATFKPITIAGRSAGQTAAIQASWYADIVASYVLNYIEKILDAGLDKIIDLEKAKGNIITLEKLAHVKHNLIASMNLDMIKQHVAEMTDNVLKGTVTPVPEEMEAELYLPNN